MKRAATGALRGRIVQLRFCTTEAERVSKEISRSVEQAAGDIVKPLDVWNKFGGALRDRPETPMVLLLGNHSAGKSTFINNLIGDQVQETGVAPTDDGFTVIMRGDVDVDEDGPTLVGTHRHGFQSLSSFGPGLVSHLKLKVRKMDHRTKVPHSLVLIDSPGNIGSPKDGSTNNDRGYDLLKATRWFAERADVILLLFDPANPGTTGETLDVLTNSLADLDHKFLLVMNKVDQFDTVTDFARAYGALCWNLSKVINKKDIPRVYTMCAPNMVVKDGSGLPLETFEMTREKVIGEALKAPERRVNNLLTALSEASIKTMIATKVTESLRRKYKNTKSQIRAGIALGTVGALSAVATASAWPTIVAGSAATLTAAGVAEFSSRKWLESYQTTLISGMDGIVKSEVPGSDDQNVLARYQSIKPFLIEKLSEKELSSIPKTRNHNRLVQNLDRLIKSEIPRLREKACKVRYSANNA